MSKEKDLAEQLMRGFELALGTGDRAAIERYVRTGSGDLPGDARLLVWDANSVHAYVFDTGNASVIRGASLLLNELDERIAEGETARLPVLRIHPEQILYSGGGGGMAVVSGAVAEMAEAALHRAFVETTFTATCSAASVELRGRSFRDAKAAVHAEMASNRTLQGTDATAPLPFFAWRCQLCGQRAAADEKDRLAQGSRRECAVCHHRLERGKEDASDEAENFDHIRSQHGDMAVIYFDGNRMGDSLMRLESPLDFARFSLALKTCLRSVVGTAIEKHGLKADSTEHEGRGYQVPILGGDDLVMVVPGDVAVPMARDLLAGFERAVDDDADLSRLSREPLGACAGVAIGRLPIRHLLKEAEEYLESAKKRVYREDKLRSCLDFGVIADGRPRRSSHEAPRLVHKPEKLLFSAKPFSLCELERFWKRKAVLQDSRDGLAPSQLHACRRVADSGRNQLRNHVLFQIGRHEDWQHVVKRLVEVEPKTPGDPLLDPDVAFACLVPRYGDFEVFDIADMLELAGLGEVPERQAS